MAKRSSKGEPRRGDERKTGIYVSRTDSAPFSDIKAAKKLFDECGFDETLHDIMDRLEKAVTELIAADATKPHEIERRKEAEKLARDVLKLRGYMTDTAKPERVGYLAYYLGVLAERIGMRHFEPFAARAIMIEDKRVAGFNRKHPTEKRKGLVREAARRIRQANPRITKTALVEMIVAKANEGGWTVSERSIWSYLKPDPE